MLSLLTFTNNRFRIIFLFFLSHAHTHTHTHNHFHYFHEPRLHYSLFFFFLFFQITQETLSDLVGAVDDEEMSQERNLGTVSLISEQVSGRKMGLRRLDALVDAVLTVFSPIECHHFFSFLSQIEGATVLVLNKIDLALKKRLVSV